MVHFYKMVISWVVFFILSKFWFSGFLVEEKGKKWSKVRKNPVRHTPYLRNHTSYDFHLCIYGANDNNDNGTNDNVFFYFIKILIFQVFRGHQKGKKKYTKNSANCTLYLRNHTSYDCHLWFTSVSWWYFQTFF